LVTTSLTRREREDKCSDPVHTCFDWTRWHLVAGAGPLYLEDTLAVGRWCLRPKRGWRQGWRRQRAKGAAVLSQRWSTMDTPNIQGTTAAPPRIAPTLIRTRGRGRGQQSDTGRIASKEAVKLQVSEAHIWRIVHGPPRFPSVPSRSSLGGSTLMSGGAWPP
jgi:hypothetical protein